MKTDFRHYIKEVRQRVTKDACDYSRAVIWVITIVITHLVVFQHVLYSMCPSVWMAGLPCPACGMTRAGMLVLTGHFREAAYLQPFIYGIFAFAVLLVVYRYILLKDSLRWVRWYLTVMGICMILFYIYRMVRFFPDTYPMNYCEYNLLHYLKVLFRRIVIQTGL